MDDKEKNISPEQPNETTRNPKEDIPLWLQGLEEETQANRLKAAQDESLISSGEEAEQGSTTIESPLEEIAVHETPYEDSVSAEEIIISDEENDEPSLDQFGQDEARLNEFSVIEELAPQPEEEVSQTSPSLEPASETIEEVEKAEDLVPSGSLSDESPIPETSDTIDDSPEPASEGIWSKEMESALVEDIVSDDIEAEELSGLPKVAEPISQETPSEEEEDEDTEEISVQPLSEPLEEPDDLEWVSEVPEFEDEFSSFEEEPVSTQEGDKNKVFGVDEGLEAESTPAEINSFIDISGATLDENESPQPEVANDLSALGEDIFLNKEAEFSTIEDQVSENSEFPAEDEQPDQMRDKIIPDDEGLVFINEEISSYDETQEFSKDELLPDDEDLPKWLQRLIADSYPDNHIDESEFPGDESWDEITKPVEIPLEDFSGDELHEDSEFVELDFINELEEAELAEVEVVEEPKISELVTSQSTREDEITIEDTAPVQVAADDNHFVKEDGLIEWTDDDNLYFNPENGYVVEIPEPLQFARQVLIHGDVSQALEIIRKYIAEESFLDEIRMWLTETANSSKNHKSEIWESLGDIAASQNNHQEALSAYSKAINLLLVHKEENGTG